MTAIRADKHRKLNIIIYTTIPRMKRLALVILLFFAALTQAAPKRATITTALNSTALQPGQQAVVAVIVDIAPGFHAQSHTPSAPNYIKFQIQPQDTGEVQWHDPIYPAGKSQFYADLGELNVYSGHVVVYIPIEVKPDAHPADITLQGKAVYQICDDRVCYAPEHRDFTLETKIVPAGVAVQPSNGEIFRDFDPRIFSKISTKVAKPPTAVAPVNIDLFGHQFVLAETAYWIAFPLAFVVGLIFNLMPCVLPVLPLKAVGFYEVARHNRARSLLLGTIFSIGLIGAFAGLALLVVVFRTITWGQQFSSPWFVAIIVTILVGFALAQFGVFSVVLPTKIYSFAPSHETYTGNFLFGIFTAVLSTPCTAPMFVGLLAWATRQPSWVGVTSIMTVGLGMASPYWILSALPEVARRMPRTGPWANLLKQMMGFLLLAVAVYFAGGKLLAGRQFIWAVFAVVAAASVFLVVRTSQITKGFIYIAAAAIVALLMGGVTLGFALRVSGFGHSQQAELIRWMPYTPEVADAGRHTGKIVIVEFTANWCANCLALEATVFHDPQIAKAFDKYNVLALRADLTEESAPGWQLLKQLNPAGGIPLTAIYPANTVEPIELSSVYSSQNLLDAIDKASRTALVQK